MQAAEALAAQLADGITPQADSAGLSPWEPKTPQAVAPAHSSSCNWEPTGALAQPAVPSSLDNWESECSHIRRDPDTTLRPLNSPTPGAPRPVESLASPAEDGSERLALDEEPWGAHELEPVEPDMPIHANLIQFPRELVATRKMRPRLAEESCAVPAPERQLSIFEVDPGAISLEAETASAASAPAWPEPKWSGIELEAQPPSEVESQEAPAPLPALQLAPIGHRLMAALVDGALIVGAFLASVLVATANIGHPPAARSLEMGAALALLLVGLLYHTLFLTLAEATPGMRYARISLCTFDGQSPTRAQLLSRLGALLLSVLPVGLGVLWILFDDDRLSWHDRLSQTYPRKC
jgi:uncharacterized RDD family membrane protein YckC